MARGFASASALPEDAASLLLGASFGPDSARGMVDLNVNLGRDVFAFASGEFANSGDWRTGVGLKMRW